MIEKKTVVDQIEILRSGVVQIRFGLLLIEDGKELASQWHRTSIEPGDNMDAQIAAVNTNLTSMGQTICPPAEIARVRALLPIVHTPDVIARFRAGKR